MISDFLSVFFGLLAAVGIGGVCGVIAFYILRFAFHVGQSIGERIIARRAERSER